MLTPQRMAVSIARSYKFHHKPSAFVFIAVGILLMSINMIIAAVNDTEYGGSSTLLNLSSEFCHQFQMTEIIHASISILISFLLIPLFFTLTKYAPRSCSYVPLIAAFASLLSLAYWDISPISLSTVAVFTLFFVVLYFLVQQRLAFTSFVLAKVGGIFLSHFVFLLMLVVVLCTLQLAFMTVATWLPMTESRPIYIVCILLPWLFGVLLCLFASNIYQVAVSSLVLSKINGRRRPLQAALLDTFYSIGSAIPFQLAFSTMFLRPDQIHRKKVCSKTKTRYRYMYAQSYGPEPVGMGVNGMNIFASLSKDLAFSHVAHHGGPVIKSLLKSSYKLYEADLKAWAALYVLPIISECVAWTCIICFYLISLVSGVVFQQFLMPEFNIVPGLAFASACFLIIGLNISFLFNAGSIALIYSSIFEDEIPDMNGEFHSWLGDAFSLIPQDSL